MSRPRSAGGPVRARPGQRGFDALVAVLGLVLLSPLLATVAAAILVADGRPVLFLQRRVGRRGCPFTIVKFRTMVRDAERLGGQITVGADRRVTRIGAWLRRTKIDELPQLLNVLRGDMSLVGPRPEVPRYVAAYGPEQRALLRLRPGVTDPASIAFRDESELLARFADPATAYARHLLPAKARVSLGYARRASLASDVRVLVTTALRRLGPAGRRGGCDGSSADAGPRDPGRPRLVESLSGCRSA